MNWPTPSTAYDVRAWANEISVSPDSRACGQRFEQNAVVDENRDYRWMMINATPQEAQRLRLKLFEETLDPHTLELLSNVDLTDASVLEIGAGAGSITEELALRVGPEGRVTAVDIDVSHLRPTGPTVTVRQQDLRLDHDFGAATVDFVHCRSVLAFLPERDAILAALVTAVRPGGHLLIEEALFDAPAFLVDRTPAVLARFLTDVFPTVVRTGGASMRYGEQVPYDLADAGLEILAVHQTGRSGNHSAPYTRLMVATVAAMRSAFVQAHLADDAEIDDVLDLLSTTTLPIPAGPLVSTLARKAPAGH